MPKPKHVSISLLIVAVIGLHAVPLVQRLQGDRQTLWPILAWGMYKHSVDSDKPVQTSVKRIFVKTARGEETEVHPDDVGLSSYAINRMYITPMLNGDGSAAASLAERLNRHRADPIVAVRLESDMYTITDAGLEKKTEPPRHYRITE